MAINRFSAQPKPKEVTSKYVGLPLDFMTKQIEKKQATYSTAKEMFGATDIGMSSNVVADADQEQTNKIHEEYRTHMDKLVTDANGDYSQLLSQAKELTMKVGADVRLNSLMKVKQDIEADRKLLDQRYAASAISKKEYEVGLHHLKSYSGTRLNAAGNIVSGYESAALPKYVDIEKKAFEYAKAAHAKYWNGFEYKGKGLINEIETLLSHDEEVMANIEVEVKHELMLAGKEWSPSAISKGKALKLKAMAKAGTDPQLYTKDLMARKDRAGAALPTIQKSQVSYNSVPFSIGKDVDTDSKINMFTSERTLNANANIAKQAKEIDDIVDSVSFGADANLIPKATAGYGLASKSVDFVGRGYTNATGTLIDNTNNKLISAIGQTGDLLLNSKLKALKDKYSKFTTKGASQDIIEEYNKDVEELTKDFEDYSYKKIITKGGTDDSMSDFEALESSLFEKFDTSTGELYLPEIAESPKERVKNMFAAREKLQKEIISTLHIGYPEGLISDKETYAKHATNRINLLNGPMRNQTCIIAGDSDSDSSGKRLTAKQFSELLKSATPDKGESKGKVSASYLGEVNNIGKGMPHGTVMFQLDDEKQTKILVMPPSSENNKLASVTSRAMFAREAGTAKFEFGGNEGTMRYNPVTGETYGSVSTPGGERPVIKFITPKPGALELLRNLKSTKAEKDLSDKEKAANSAINAIEYLAKNGSSAIHNSALVSYLTEDSKRLLDNTESADVKVVNPEVVRLIAWANKQVLSERQQNYLKQAKRR